MLHTNLIKFALIILFNFSPVIVNAQAPQYSWANSIGGSVGDEGRQIAIDDTGNIYSTGIFTGTVDFDPGPGIVNLTSSVGRQMLSRPEIACHS